MLSQKSRGLIGLKKSIWEFDCWIWVENIGLREIRANHDLIHVKKNGIVDRFNYWAKLNQLKINGLKWN
jgi:hypothetical protein